MKTILFSIFSIFASSQSFATSPAGTADFYITGYETSNIVKHNSADLESQVIEMPYIGSAELHQAYGHQESGRKHSPKTKTLRAAPVTAEENADGLRKTLESFQKAISGLCISHLELSLAFNVSAKAWMIVTGEVDGSVKVILKNPDEKCPKAKS